MKKVLFTLAIGDYPHEITDLTYPWLKYYARKIGAEFVEIKERKFPEWGITYEKHQIWKLGKDLDWCVFIDADALILPELFDVTALVPMDHVAFAGQDMSAMRFAPDIYSLRDGRYIGACTWFVVSSKWTHDLWRPVDDMTPEECYSRIHPTRGERRSVGITPEKLIEDWTLSRNIAKFGLKHTTVEVLKAKFNRRENMFWHPVEALKEMANNNINSSYWHQYTIPIDHKVLALRKVIADTKLPEGGWL